MKIQSSIDVRNNESACTLDLMELAGKAIYEVVARIKPLKTLVIVGSGGNGGDGFVLARLLHDEGYIVDVYEIGNTKYSEKKEKYKGNYASCINETYDLIVDAIFGIGLNRQIEDDLVSIIKEINSFKTSVISIDIPSGINADNGLVMGIAVKADMTITFDSYKLGHLLNDGKDFSGDVVVKVLGMKISHYSAIVVDDSYKIKRRKYNSHKGDYGKACIIAGSKEFLGASIISYNGLAAIRLGAGYSTLCIPNSLYEFVALKVPECTIKVIEDNNGSILYDEVFLETVINSTCIAIGMGLGISEDVYLTIKFLLNNFSGVLLIDADGLNSLAKYGIEILKDKKSKVILTPHIKEFSRLSCIPVEEIIANPLRVAQFAKEYDLIVALKSSTTVITDGDDIYININGTPALAKGGSGDVLSGILCGVHTFDSGDMLKLTNMGCFILGRACELAVVDLPESTVIASDIVSQIPNVIKEWQ